ncbi:MAG: zinc ABC transporter substrate-binding protein [Planctomycetota bacterium]
MNTRLFALLLLPFTLGCEPEPGSTEQPNTSDATDKLTVVCTTGMIADAALSIAGEHANVVALMGPGVDPHLFPMSRKDQGRLLAADVVLYHGLHLEGKMATFLKDLKKKTDRKRTVSAVAETIPDDRLIRSELFGEYPDPHVWFDLKLWKVAVNETLRTLSEADPAHAADYKRRGGEYLAKIDETHDWAVSKLEGLPKETRRIVTSHDAYNYFARAYSFDVHGLQGISTESRAGIRDIEKAVRYVQTHKVPMIFAETSVNASGVEAVSKQSGAKISPKKLYSDALGAAGSPEATLLGMFRHNLTTIVDALSTGEAK